MPIDPTRLTDDDLVRIVRGIVSEVMMVPLEEVQLESALVADLGGESIDFLDLVFRIEESLEVKIPHRRWEGFVRERFRDQDLARVITTRTMVEFARNAITSAAAA